VSDPQANHASPVEPRPAEPAANRLAGAGGQPGSLKDRVRSLRLPQRTDRSYTPQRLPWVLCLVFALTTAGALALAFTRSGSRPEDTREPGRTGESRPAGVASSGEVALTSKGYIVPRHPITVSPKVSGMITRLYIEEGDLVQKGEVLAELEKTEYQADYDRCWALADAAHLRWQELDNGWRIQELGQARAELEETIAQRDTLEQDYQRNLKLAGTSALARRDYEQAYSSFRAMDRRAERLRHVLDLMLEGQRYEKKDAAWAEWEQCVADLDRAKWRLDNCTIHAPVTGIITSRKSEEGNIVNPVAFNISASICDMADLTDLEVDLTIQERDVGKVSKYQDCRIRAEAYPDRVYEGFVSRIMPLADRAKGAVPVRVKVLGLQGQSPLSLEPEAGQYLRPDMSVMVTLLKGERPGARDIPTRSAARRQ
jgi:multidrug resistance efflux pump